MAVPGRRRRPAGALLVLALAAWGIAARADAATETLIVLNKQEATAWLVDPASGEVRAKLAVGDGPHEAAVSPDGRTAVVCNYGARVAGSTLTVLDVPGRRVTKTIPLDPYDRPHGIRFLNDGRHVLVTCETSRRLLRVDVARGKITDAIDIGVDAHLLAVSEDGTRAYGAGIGRGAVGAIDLGRRAAAPRIRSTGRGTEAIAVRPGSGEVWVGSNDLDRVAVLDPATLEIVAEIECGLTPIRIAFTPDGRRALVSCAVSGDLAVLDAERKRIVRRIPLSDVYLKEEEWKGREAEQIRPAAERVARHGARPIGVLVAPGGTRAYVALNARDEIAVVAIESGTVVRRLPTGTGPDGMAWSRID